MTPDQDHQQCVGSLRPEDDPSWECYGDTILELDGGAVELDLRTPLAAEQRAAVDALGIGDRFAVVTPYNRAGQTDSPESNEARHRRMLDRLTAARVRWVRADGLSVDRGHREPGFAVAMPRDEARALAAEFGQSAIFWYDHGVVWLVGALADSEPEPLPK